MRVISPGKFRPAAQPGPEEQPIDDVVDVIRRNLRALQDVQKETDRRRSWEERVADNMMRVTGSMGFIYFHLLWFGSWLLLNSGRISWFRPWDPYPFVMLAVFASVEAIFLATFVLISQKRMTTLETRRAQLDLQINLLAEHEITHLIHMVDAIAQHLGLPAAGDSKVEQLKQDVAPEVVLQEIENNELEQEELKQEAAQA